MSLSKQNAWGKTELGIVQLLENGNPIPWKILKASYDPESSNENLRRYVTKIRKFVRPRGFDVLCVIFNRRVCYQLVRSFSSDDT